MLTATNFNQRRMMIITSDEKIIEQIRTTNNPTSSETFIFECDKDNCHLSPDNNQSMQRRRTKFNQLRCVICGSIALGRNFGVITCESCKIFFRRNALKNPGAFRCRQKNACEITLTTRRRCSSCRLAKCLIYGMKRDRLLKAEEKAASRHKMKESRYTMQSNSAMDDQKASWRLSTYPNHPCTSNNINPIYKNVTSCISQSVLQLNRVTLTQKDLEHIDAIDIAFEKNIESDTLDASQLHSYVHETSLSEHLNSYSVSAMELLTFFKEIPEFDALNVDDKLTLTKYNLLCLLILNATVSFNIGAKQITLEDCDLPWNSPIARAIHGIDICFEIKKIFNSFLDIRLYDNKIIEMALVVLFLTKGLSIASNPSEPLLVNSMHVQRAQHFYTELLWKYMEAVHGFEKACRIFNQMITRFLTWQTLGGQIRDNIERFLSKIDENELSPLMKSLLCFT